MKTTSEQVSAPNPSTPEATRPQFQLTAEENATNAIDILLDGRPIATIIDEEGDEVTDEMRTLARLFAAAPDLLEAARMAHEFITRIANTMPVAANGESLTLLKLSAAIQKTERGQ